MSPQQQMVSESDPRARHVVDVRVADEMSDSFLAYGLSVITARAIPDVRDGLKPVQRRILWSMLQMGVRPGTPFRKSARIVGDTMGRYHPHGDAAIYDALVRLGQEFSRRVPLVEPQGNFGSLDDPPAAARYTECRLSDAAMGMVAEVEEDTVDFRPTYDGEDLEPAVLPAAFPNLLVNGTAGIAVGMATNMAPHNLGEIGEAIELVLGNEPLAHDRGTADEQDREARASSEQDREARAQGVQTLDFQAPSSRGLDAQDSRSQASASPSQGNRTTTDELLRIVPGPDFPGGGRVVEQGMRQVYESGRGPVRVQARVSVEQVTRRRRAIVVTELPYQVGAERVVAKTTKLVEAGRLPDVAGIADLTDADGLRIRINLKPGADARAALSALFRLTPLEETFHVNNVVLVEGVPTTLGLRELCRHYIRHRLNVIVRRSRHRRRQARRRLEIVDGLLTALDGIDEVVALIRRSRSPSEARRSLRSRFGLTELQAARILDMPLRRLTALERQKLADEAEALREAIADYGRILGSERRRREVVREELQQIVKEHGTPRRSEMSELDADGLPADFDHARPAGGQDDGRSAAGIHGSGGTGRGVSCVVTVSTSGSLGKEPVTGARRKSPGRHDLLAARVSTSTAAPLGMVTSQGRAFVLRADEAADASSRSRGAPVAPMLGLAKAERVLALVTDGHESLLAVTASGMAVRLRAESVLSAKYGDPIVELAAGDRVVSAFPASDDADLVIVTGDAKALRTPVSDFRKLSSVRPSRGVIGIRPRSGAEVAGAGVVARAAGAGAAGVPSDAAAEESGRTGAGGRGTAAAASGGSGLDGSGQQADLFTSDRGGLGGSDPRGRPGRDHSAPPGSGASGADGGVVVVATTAGGLKATSCDDLAPRGRGGQGVFIAKLGDGERVSAVAVVPGCASGPAADAGTDAVGSGAGWRPGVKLMAVKARDADPRKMDPRPVEVRVEPSKRYAKPARHGRRVLLLAPSRW